MSHIKIQGKCLSWDEGEKVMKIDEFTKYLEALPKEVSWYMENTRFKGYDLVEAQIFFSLPYPQEEEEE